MIYLLLAILSSAMIAILMRISSHRISANLSMLAVNYLMCVFLGAVYTGFDPMVSKQSGFLVTLLLGLLSGVLYLGGFVLLQYNTRKNGIVLSSVFMKLGLLVPVVLSMLLFKEIPTGIQIIGFGVAVFAIVLINLKKDHAGKGLGPGLILMLLMCGGCDAMSKVYERLGPAALSDSYLFYTFVVAFLLCLALTAWKKERLGFREVVFGILLAVPNFYSARFLLDSLKTVPAVIAYPTFSVGTILIVTLSGVLLFKERLSKRQWIALVIILGALALLNL